jgi:hypothetical protein
MHEFKACVAKLLADNSLAYADCDPDSFDGCCAEDWGDILAHVAYVIARDEEHLETFRKDGDRFAAICAGFAASAQRCEMLRQCKADFRRNNLSEATVPILWTVAFLLMNTVFWRLFCWPERFCRFKIQYRQSDGQCS